MRAGKLRSSRIATLLASVLVAGGLLLPAAVTAQSVYTIDDLGVLPGDTSSVSQGINERGDVAGDNGNTSITGTMEAFTYVDPGPMAAIALPFRGRGRDINDSGQVTGYMTGAANRAFRTYFDRLSLCARKSSATYFLHDPNGLLPAGFDSSCLPCAGGSYRDKPARLPRAKIAGPNARQIFPRCVPLGIRGDSRLLTFYLTRTNQSRRTAT